MRKLAIAGLLCLSLSPAARAQSVIYVDADATGADNGSSWADAHTDFQDALSAAASGDEIWVAEGTYRPTDGSDRTNSFALVPGVALYGGFAGDEATRDERDWTAHVTILSGDLNGDDDPTKPLDDPARNNGENCYHVIVGASNATLDGFAIAAGNANATDWPGYDGGGMDNSNVTGLAVTNCTFRDNRAGHDGGFGYGGGLSNSGSVVTVIGCTFSGNSANTGGGGMWESFSSSAIADCVFLGNRASGGAGMRNSHSSPTVANCLFTGNTADYGGGMYNWDSCPVVTNCTFSSNTAGDCGGGIHNSNDGSPVVSNCVFSENFGSGMHNWDACPVVTNCTFSGNTRGGMHNQYSSPALTNCVLWGDTLPGREIYDERDSSSVVTCSCVQGSQEGYRNIDADPLFMDGAAGDFRLQPSSPCIDRADGDEAPEFDIDGKPRHDDPGVKNRGHGAVAYADIGACEFQGTSTDDPGDLGVDYSWPVTPFAGGCGVSRRTRAPGPVPLALLALAACSALARRRRRA